MYSLALIVNTSWPPDFPGALWFVLLDGHQNDHDPRLPSDHLPPICELDGDPKASTRPRALWTPPAGYPYSRDSLRSPCNRVAQSHALEYLNERRGHCDPCLQRRKTTTDQQHDSDQPFTHTKKIRCGKPARRSCRPCGDRIHQTREGLNPTRSQKNTKKASNNRDGRSGLGKRQLRIIQCRQTFKLGRMLSMTFALTSGCLRAGQDLGPMAMPPNTPIQTKMINEGLAKRR